MIRRIFDYLSDAVPLVSALLSRSLTYRHMETECGQSDFGFAVPPVYRVSQTKTPRSRMRDAESGSRKQE